MSTITIEKNIPVPANKRTNKYPLNTMEIGDSFVVPLEMAPKSGIYPAISVYARRAGTKYTIRAIEDSGGWRVWRTA
jgi:hypothetical protein